MEAAAGKPAYRTFQFRRCSWSRRVDAEGLEFHNGMDATVTDSEPRTTRPNGISLSAPKGRQHARRIRILILLAAMAGGGAIWSGANTQPADPTEPLLLHGVVDGVHTAGPTLRVGTFNICGGKGLDGLRDLGRTADCLHDLDLIGLNEVRGSFGGGQQNQAAVLGAKLDMAWLYAATERRWWHNHFGNGLLSGVALDSVHRIVLPGTQGKKFRGAILATVRHRGRPVRVLVAHIDRVRDRERQLSAVCDLFLALEEPAILLGDLNTRPSDEQIKRLLAVPGVSDALGETLQSDASAERVDWIITRGLRCLSAEYNQNSASDHPAVVAELALPDMAEP